MRGFFPNFFGVIPVTDVLVTDRGLEVHYIMEKLTGAPSNTKDKDHAKHREGLPYDYYRLEAPDSVEEAIKHGPADNVLPPPASRAGSRLCRVRTRRRSSTRSSGRRLGASADARPAGAGGGCAQLSPKRCMSSSSAPK